MNRTGIQTMCFLLLVGLATSFPPLSAWATTGGESLIEVLGFEPTDNKVYLLRHEDDAMGGPPQLMFYDLGSDAPEKLVGVRSWYEPEKIDQFEQKLAALRGRLQPLVEAVPEGLTVCQRVTNADACPVDFPMWGRRCLTLELTVNVGAASASATVESWGQGRVVEAFAVPGGAHLVLFRHIGNTYEMGYDVDVPFLLFRRGNLIPIGGG